MTLLQKLALLGQNTKEFYKNHSGWLLPVVVLLLLVGSFGAGRFSAPTKVVEKEKIVEKAIEKIVVQVKEVEKIVYVQQKKEKTKTETTTTKTPDGTEITKTKTETSTDTDTKTDTDKSKDTVRVEERIVEKIVEKEKIVFKSNNDWRVGAGVGVSIPVFLGQNQIGVPGLQGAVIQVEAERRVFGNFYMGLFGNTQGVAGLSVSGTF